MEMTLVELMSKYPVSCDIFVRKLRFRRKMVGTMLIAGKYGAPTYNCEIVITVTPSKVSFKGGWVTSKVNTYDLSETDLYDILTLPPIDSAVARMKAMAAGVE